ncbi:hypothetical protein JCM1841_003969 [Sporobolomyces salmonicolor]
MVLSRALFRSSAPRSVLVSAAPAARRPNLLLSRNYADIPTGDKPTTSTSHPTVPHAPPKPTPFFARQNIGLEVTPLMAFLATIALLATGSLVRNLLTDKDIHQRHGVPNDEALEKVLASDAPAAKGGDKKDGAKADEGKK